MNEALVRKIDRMRNRIEEAAESERNIWSQLQESMADADDSGRIWHLAGEYDTAHRHVKALREMLEDLEEAEAEGIGE